MTTAIIELYALAYAIRAPAEYHDLAAFAGRLLARTGGGPVYSVFFGDAHLYPPA
jgi:predicted fused transcriptional regulator/phosphomethylpyrimidine kinase